MLSNLTRYWTITVSSLGDRVYPMSVRIVLREAYAISGSPEGTSISVSEGLSVWLENTYMTGVYPLSEILSWNSTFPSSE